MEEAVTKSKNHSIILSDSFDRKELIAVLMGGWSSEREVSLVSGQMVSKALLDLGYNIVQIDIGLDIAAVLNKLQPSKVFNALHGRYGEDGSIQGLLNIMHIPYTHSGVLASSICMNKLTTRSLLQNEILFAPSAVVKKQENCSKDPMPRPYIIKPLEEGSSVGVELVLPNDQFKFGDYEFKYGDQVIVEKYISGRELNVGILNGKALGISEIQVVQGKFYDYNAKYTEGASRHFTPTDLPKQKEEELMQIAEHIYHKTGCNGVARLEFIYEGDKFYFLEVNTQPGLTPTSIIPDIAAGRGINFGSLIEEILNSAKCE